MKLLLVAISIFLMSGCAAQMDAFSNLGVINEKVSTFDNKRIVEVSPTWVASDGAFYAASTKVGALWSEASPSRVLLILKYESTVDSSNSYTTYESLSVNIDGTIRNFPVSGSTELESSGYNTVSNTIYTASTALVPIPLDYLRKMVEASDVQLRFNYLNRYEDGNFGKEEGQMGQQMAKARIIEFLKLI